MTPQALAAAVDEFAAARGGARLVGAPPAGLTLADGWEIQAELARRAGAGAVRGWKVGAVTAAQQAKAGVGAPIAARLMAPWFAASPARMERARFVRPLIECEIAFRIGRDLPPRPGRPYAKAEVIDAVDALVPAIEVADARTAPQPPTPLFLADQMANGDFVHGAPLTDWRGIDRAAASVALVIDGHAIGSGRGDALLPDPLDAVVAFAGHPPPGAAGLRRGEIVTTGALAPVTPIEAGSTAVADFGALGRVEVRFT